VLAPELEVVPLVIIPGIYQNASLAVDARLVGSAADVDDRFVVMACRANPLGQYRLTVNTDTRTASLSVAEQGEFRLLWRGSLSAIRLGNQANHLELSCAGSTISVIVNGEVAAAVEDSTHAEGWFWIGGIVDNGLGEIHFDHLMVTQQ
jgi:hypothetical protein